jgi:hypothetical protein
MEAAMGAAMGAAMEAATEEAMEAATEESMEAANQTVAVPMVFFQFLNSFYVWKSAFRVLPSLQ